LILKTTIVVCEINKLLCNECIFLMQPQARRATAGFMYMAFHMATQEILQPPVPREPFTRESVHKSRERALKKASHS